MLKIKSKTPTPPPIEEEVVEEQPLEIKVYMDYIGEEGYVYKYNKEKGKYYKSSICLMGPKGNPGIRGPKGDPGAGADVDLSQYASKSYVDDKISNLINSAPEALDTLGELATKVGDLMPLHGNTGDVDGFRLSYINGENTDPAMLELYKAMLALGYNNDNPANEIALSTLTLDTSSLYGSIIKLSPNGHIDIGSLSMSSNNISGLITLLTNNRFNVSCVTDNGDEPLLSIEQDYILLGCENGVISMSKTGFDFNSPRGFEFRSTENIPLLRDYIHDGTFETYPVLDGYYTKTINSQSLFWDGTGEKNIELVTKTELEQTEEVIATALTDLDTRINNSIKSIKVNGTALTPDNNKAVDITVPTVPTISTNITTDATDDMKTASPKAVKTYADSIAGNNSVFIYDIDASNLVNGTKTVSDNSAHAAILAAYNAGKAVYIRWTNSAQYLEPIIPLLSYESNTFTFIYNVVIPTLNSVLMYGVTVYTTTVEVNHASNTYYTKPSTGIPASDLANSVIETPVVSHGTNDTTFALTPNVLHTWGTVISLTLTLAMPSDNTIVNEYMFEFISGSTPTTLSLPSSITWADSCGVLNVEANKKYLISIMNNIGVWCSVSTT